MYVCIDIGMYIHTFMLKVIYLFIPFLYSSSLVQQVVMWRPTYLHLHASDDPPARPSVADMIQNAALEEIKGTGCNNSSISSSRSSYVHY